MAQTKSMFIGSYSVSLTECLKRKKNIGFVIKINNLKLNFTGANTVRVSHIVRDYKDYTTKHITVLFGSQNMKFTTNNR